MKRFFTLQNLFLFAIIIVLPICVSYYSINNMLEEQYLAIRDNMSRELRQQIAKIEYTSNAEYQIKDFLDFLIKQNKICRQKPETIKEFIDNSNEKYPNAFKWLFLDENYNVLPINSQNILTPSRYWQAGLHGGIISYNWSLDGNPPQKDYDTIKNNYEKSLSILQPMLGSDNKAELIFEKRSSVVETNWNGKKCYIVWDIDGIDYNQYGVATKIAGVCCLMVFPDNLPEDIWYKRLVVRRKNSVEKYKFPIAAINISDSTAFALDANLPNNESNFVKELINSYNSRSTEIFSFKNYLIGATFAPQESEIRLLSMADTSEIQKKKDFSQLLLKIACISLIIISFALAIYINTTDVIEISLRQRIAAIFMVAIIIPLISLISIGKIFIIHEESRLKESALVKMRESIEALSMRYKDTPRLIERDLFNTLKTYVASQPVTIDSVSSGMQKAVNDGVIDQFILFEDNKIASTSWKNIDPSIKNGMIFWADKLMGSYDKNEKGTDNKTLLKTYVEDEITDTLSSVVDIKSIFSRPSHLRNITFADKHMYFMLIIVNLDNKPNPLFVYLPDKLVEQNFAEREFASNNIAKQNYNNLIVPELTFYSTLPGSDSLPPESPIWDNLRSILKRASELKIEENGIVKIENEEFLYLTKPLSTMNSKSYLPFLMASTSLIRARLKDVTILLFALSAFAVIGSILLSFALSSSLLIPIKKIDDAAQQVGEGNLEVSLPEEGNDELGRLSVTFNQMVQGLREREKMQAYVSDSVLEAVKDNSDQQIHEGKNIEATILFSDIRNFTGISEANTPEKIFEVLNEFLGGVEPIIRENHGRVDKFIGDAVMAIFHDDTTEPHALSAVKAAVEIKEFLKTMNEERQQKGLFPIEIGIGISTGNVLLGDVGNSMRKDLTVIGDEVNLASRLETASKQGHHSKIIFSGQTYSIIENYVEAEKMPFEEIRGKKNAVQIYELIKFKDEEAV